MYSFFLYDFCDIYLEATKARSAPHFPYIVRVFYIPAPGRIFLCLRRALCLICHRFSPRMSVAVP